MASDVIIHGAEHIDRPVPDGITGIYVFPPDDEWKSHASASCDLSGCDGTLVWSVGANGQWDFEWERPPGYGCGCPNSFRLDPNHVEFLVYLASLVAPALPVEETERG